MAAAAEGAEWACAACLIRGIGGYSLGCPPKEWSRATHFFLGLVGGFMTAPVSIGLNCSCPSHNDQCCPRILRVRWCCIGIDDDLEEKRQDKLKDMLERAVEVEGGKVKKDVK